MINKLFLNNYKSEKLFLIFIFNYRFLIHFPIIPEKRNK